MVAASASQLQWMGGGSRPMEDGQQVDEPGEGFWVGNDHWHALE
jgi:hypothetical protein